MSETITLRMLKNFPALQEIVDPAWHRTIQSALVISQPAGAVLFRGGDACEHYFLMLEGVVRVQKVSEDGHEITLYRIQPGQVCELTTSCLLAEADYSAEAIAETDVRVLLIPKASFYEAITGSPAFRKFVFASLDQGMHELVHLLEEVAFGHLDHRLGDGGIVGIAGDVADEGAVDLDGVDRQMLQVRQRGMAGAEIVDGDSYAHLLDGAQGADDLFGAVQHHAFRDFDLQLGRVVAGGVQEMLDLGYELRMV